MGCWATDKAVEILRSENTITPATIERTIRETILECARRANPGHEWRILKLLEDDDDWRGDSGGP